MERHTHPPPGDYLIFIQLNWQTNKGRHWLKGEWASHKQVLASRVIKVASLHGHIDLRHNSYEIETKQVKISFRYRIS